MVKPLSFKGDKPKKRKRATEGEDEAIRRSKSLTSTSKPSETIVEEDDSWVSADAVSDISGPIILVLPTTAPACLASDAHGKIFPLEIENMVADDPSTAEPHDVRQVWVANRITGMESFNFKGHHGKYLGCDKFGTVSATNEAVSAEESWIIVPTPDSVGMFAVQSLREKFLTVGEKVKAEAQVRGDADSIGFAESLRIRMQARYKPRLKANKEERRREKISQKELEEAVGRRLEDDEVKILKKARREGNYHETLLDIKVKGKHDKFA